MTGILAGFPHSVPATVGEANLAADEGSRFILGMDEEAYHARPEISASGLKVVVRSPKAFLAARSAPRVEKKAFDVGHAIHAAVLGVGAPVAEIPDDLLSGEFRSVSSTAAKAWVADARAEGKVPLKRPEYRMVVEGAESVLRHPKARLFLEAPGVPEVSMFAPDPTTGLALRGRADRIVAMPEGFTIVDVKTCTKLSLAALAAIVADLGYDLQGEAYRFLFELITGELAAPVVLIWMEKDPPYDVRVTRLGDVWVEGGWKKFRDALDLYARCVEARVWPGVDEEGPVADLAAPGWYAARVRAAEGLEDL